jgi:hypothetical protein
MDRTARKKRLERFSRSERIFPGGEHETGNCTACARIITQRFGGEVRGYYHADNPTARVGETQYGHDFARKTVSSWTPGSITITANPRFWTWTRPRIERKRRRVTGQKRTGS